MANGGASLGLTEAESHLRDALRALPGGAAAGGGEVPLLGSAAEIHSFSGDSGRLARAFREVLPKVRMGQGARGDGARGSGTCVPLFAARLAAVTS